MHDYLQLGFRLFSPLFRDAFQLSVTILLCYRTLDVFRVTSQCLAYSYSIFKEQYSGYLAFTSSHSSTRLSRFIALLSNRLRVSKLGKTQVQTPHPLLLSQQVRFALHPFLSPLLRASQLFSFPAHTKMLHSGAFLLLSQ